MSAASHHKFSGMIQFVPTVERILYSAGAIDAHLQSEIARLDGYRVFLLAPRSLESQPALERVSVLLGGRLAATFTAAFEHVPLDTAIETALAAQRCRGDLIVAIGGGSVIDAAKALRTCLAAHLDTAQSLCSFMQRQGALATTLLPQISIPTTLSGSEYTRSFSATDFAAAVKRSYTVSAVASRVIIYDPTVTLQTRMTLWLSSGVMAIDHALEVLCASPAHLVGDTIKLTALKTLLTYLPRTKATPNDLEARLQCQIGAWLADHSPLRVQSMPFVTTALPSHTLAHELAAVCRLPYALSACRTLPACMRWASARDLAVLGRQAEIACALGIAPPDASHSDASHNLIADLEALIAELNLKLRFRDVGISSEQLRSVASRFAQRGASLMTGRAASATEVISLSEQAF